MHRNRLFFLGIGLFVLPGSCLLASAPSTACPVERIGQLNRFSKPAAGNLDELPPGRDSKLPAPVRLKEIDSPLYHADQCRAVLGPLPKIDCRDGYLVPVRHRGKLVTYEHGTLAIDGVPTDDSVLADCDEPAMLPFLNILPKPMNGPLGIKKTKRSAGCMLNTRMGHYRIADVDWLFNCHYRPGLHEPDEPYDFVAVIGSNAQTGETCFFGHDQFKMRDTMPPVPGGESVDDARGREIAAKFWNRPSRNTCLRCHTANKPWTLTPHLNQSRLLGDGTMDFVPETPMEKRLHPGWGYRLIGVVHNQVMVRPKAIWPKNDDGTEDHTCTRCHILSDEEEFVRLARNSVGLPELPKYAQRSQGIPHSRDPWMPLGVDGHVPNPRNQEAVLRLQRAIADPKFRARETEILSPCPPPEPIAVTSVRPIVDPVAGTVGVRWTYRNEYGHVATRDDIRFELTVEGSDGTSCRLRDIAPDALGSDQWHFRQPARPGVRFTYRLKPYRYCFDRTLYSYSNEVSVTEP